MTSGTEWKIRKELGTPHEGKEKEEKGREDEGK